jgi:hypothetical protein
LIVSRGTFVTTALSLSAAVFFLNKRKFWVMLLCFIVIFGGYQVGSMTRNLTADYLNTILQPKEIVITGNDQDQGETVNDPLNADGQGQAEDEPSNVDGQGQAEDDPSNVNGSAQAENQPNDSQSQSETENLTFQLPSSVVFFYTYLTVGCDNFNQAVVHSNHMAYGVHQLVPFNVIIRSSYLRERLENSEMFYIRDYLNTGDLFSDAYYDFHIFGIVFFGILWGIAFGIIESYFLKYQTPSSFMVFGNTLVPVFLGFFQTWMSLFPQWMIWGTAFIVFIFTCFTIQNKNKLIDTNISRGIE